MRKFVNENYSFTITVLAGKKNKTDIIDCRNGHEIGDTYTFEYGCPADFCQKCMLKLFPIMEAVRSGGDLRKLGGDSENSMEFCCPDGIVRFKLEAKKHE